MTSSCVSVVTVDVDPAFEDDFNRWYNEVHLPEIVSCPGFISGTRYMCETADGRHYVAIYELESKAAFQTEELKARRGWGPFGDHIRATGRVYERIYQITADHLERG